MKTEEYEMHLRAGETYGEASTCGKKVRYSEGSAMTAAVKLTERYDRELEAYPCCWCSEWHIGRQMTDEERKRFL